jgi:hypothetical protein
MKNLKYFMDFVAEASESEYVIDYPGTGNIKYTISDSSSDGATVAKKYEFEMKITHPGAAAFVDKTIKDHVIMAFSENSKGVFSIGKDVEKFTGLKEKEAAEYKETPQDAYIFGLVNTFNGGNGLFFFNNGTRLAGAAEGSNTMLAVMEQLQHEAGIHLAHQLLVRATAHELGVDTASEDWIKHDYGSGEYMWPAIGDINDKNNPIVRIDGESYAMFSGLLCAMLMEGFFEMASKYMPELEQIMPYIKRK